MRRKNLFAVLALVLTLALVIPAVVAVPADAATTKKAVKLNKTKASIYQGKTLQLKVKNATKKVTWKSSNKNVATVSNKGLVTAVKPGKATITAKVGKKKLKCKVTVKEVILTLKCLGKKARVDEFALKVIDADSYKDDVYMDLTVNTNSIAVKCRASGTSLGGYDGLYRYEVTASGNSSFGAPYKLDGETKVPVQLSPAEQADAMKAAIEGSKSTNLCVHYKDKPSEMKVDDIERDYTLKTIAVTDKDFNGVASTFNLDQTTGAFTYTATDLGVFDPYNCYTYHIENGRAY